MGLLVDRAENARVQEDSASLNLPHFEHNTAQLPGVDGVVAHLLLRVRRPPVGNCPSRCTLHRMRREVPRKVQRPTQRRLPSKFVPGDIVSPLLQNQKLNLTNRQAYFRMLPSILKQELYTHVVSAVRIDRTVEVNECLSRNKSCLSTCHSSKKRNDSTIN